MSSWIGFTTPSARGSSSVIPVGSTTGAFWIRNAGTFSGDFVSSTAGATGLSCSASNKDVGTVAAGFAGAGSELALATGVPANALYKGLTERS